MRDCFIFAGESSGDLHGSRLLQSFKNQMIFTSIRGVGGPLMRLEGLEIVYPMEKFQVMGFSDVFKAFPRLWKLFYAIRNHILKTLPTCVILIDYPGFNLRLAKSLRKNGYQGKIIQFICPTVWAHGKERIETMVKHLDLLLTIFPFEPALFSHTPLKVEYVGNPLIETIQNHFYQNDWKQIHGIAPDHKILAIFPGSRPSEIIKHLPQQLEMALLIKKKHPSIVLALSYTNEHLLSLIKGEIKKTPLQINSDLYLIPRKFSYELMRDCYFALAKSGTVTLELALHQKPTVVMYVVSQLNYLLAKYWMRLKLPYYCIVNILLEKQTFPEFIGKTLAVPQISQQLEELLIDRHLYDNIVKDCIELYHQLGNSRASDLASVKILELFHAEDI